MPPKSNPTNKPQLQPQDKSSTSSDQPTKDTPDTFLEKFRHALVAQDMAAYTVRGYLYDLKALKVWLDDWYQQEMDWAQITPEDIQTYRTHLVKTKRHKVSAVNRRLQAIKRFYHWLQTKEKAIGKTHPAQEVRFMRIGKRTQPQALNNKEVNDLLRVAGQSSHGLAKRNYALIQLLLQSGLRIGEATQLQMRDLCLQERSGSVTVVDGKGHKTRTVPLNATARRALQAYVDPSHIKKMLTSS